MLPALPGQNLPKKTAKKKLPNPSKSSLQPPTRSPTGKIRPRAPTPPWGSWGLSAGTHESKRESDESEISCGVSHLHLWFYRNSQRLWSAGGVVGWSWFPPRKGPPQKKVQNPTWGMFTSDNFFWVVSLISCFKVASSMAENWDFWWFLDFLVVVEFITHFSWPRVPSKHPNDKFLGRWLNLEALRFSSMEKIIVHHRISFIMTIMVH